MDILGLNEISTTTLIDIIKTYYLKRVIIVGQTCSGKDHLKKALLKNGFQTSISYTTRPPRESEKDGIDYFFVSDTMFDTYVKNGYFVEWDNFNGFKYGTTFTEWNAINPNKVYIMTPHSVVTSLSKVDRASSLFIFLEVDPELQMRRLYNRGLSKQEVDQRLDEEEAVVFFAKYNWHIRIKDLKIANP
jgi:guanylate kinase